MHFPAASFTEPWSSSPLNRLPCKSILHQNQVQTTLILPVISASSPPLPKPILYPKRGKNIQFHKHQLLTPLRFAQACPLSGRPFLRPPPPRPLSVYGPFSQLGPAEVITYGLQPVLYSSWAKKWFLTFSRVKKSDRPYVAHKALSVYCQAFNRKHLNLTIPGDMPSGS